MRRGYLVVIGVVLLAACQAGEANDRPEQISLRDVLEQLPSASPTPTLAPTTTSTSTPRAAATSSSRTTTPRPTRTPTNTPDPSAPTATPEGWLPAGANGLTPNRKWFIFSRQDTGQVGGFNVDGSGFTWFDLPRVAELDYWYRMATWRNWVAYISGKPDPKEYELILALFPLGEVLFRTPIYQPSAENDYLSWSAIGTMAWSPDGEMLAVTASIGRDNTDLFLFKKRGYSFERITQEPGHAFQPRWSEDGETIFYREMKINEDGYGREIEKRRAINIVTGEQFVFDSNYIFYGGCGGDGSNYEEFTDPSGKTTVYAMQWMYGEFYGEITTSGIYIKNEGDELPRLVYRTDWSAGGLAWEKSVQMFRARVYNDDFQGYIFFDREGVVHHEFNEIEFSSDGTKLAVKDIYDRLVIYEADRGLIELWLVEEPPVVSQFYWQPDGRGLIIEALGHLYHVHLVRREVTLIARDLAGEFYINNGYWISQSE